MTCRLCCSPSRASPQLTPGHFPAYRLAQRAIEAGLDGGRAAMSPMTPAPSADGDATLRRRQPRAAAAPPAAATPPPTTETPATAATATASAATAPQPRPPAAFSWRDFLVGLVAFVPRAGFSAVQFFVELLGALRRPPATPRRTLVAVAVGCCLSLFCRRSPHVLLLLLHLRAVFFVVCSASSPVA